MDVEEENRLRFGEGASSKVSDFTGVVLGGVRIGPRLRGGFGNWAWLAWGGKCLGRGREGGGSYLRGVWEWLAWGG